MEMKDAAATVRRHALPLDNPRPLLDALRGARLVLIGEASHGTHEFYRLRAELTKALIAEQGFSLVAVEADWPDAYRVNRWVGGASEERDAESALGDFKRFPRWMWRNADVLDFVQWLRRHNAARPEGERAGFYGLDLYSLHRSVEAVLAYLDKVDPAGARRARTRYQCLEMFSSGLARGCEDEVLAQLVELRKSARESEDYFFAEHNARLVANAESYYRAMLGDRAESWNVRDRHMMETLEGLLAHAQKRGRAARAVVWAHNSHLGDARATEMSDIGEINLGQLVRERFGEAAWLIGFTTHTGTVTAAEDWDGPAGRRQVRPSLAGSYERLFHDSGLERFLLLLREAPARKAFSEERLERAIGVIYRPQTERLSHYFAARLARQFDAVIHIDRTCALQPLERWAYDETDLPETFPSGV